MMYIYSLKTKILYVAYTVENLWVCHLVYEDMLFPRNRTTLMNRLFLVQLFVGFYFSCYLLFLEIKIKEK